MGNTRQGKLNRMDGDAAHLEGQLADRDSWFAAGCSIDRAMRAIGNRSTVLLMREAFYGTRRFDDFAKRVGITEAVAAARLRELVSLGVLSRRPYREPGQRTRQEYVLTEMGRDLLPVTMALMQWGDRYLAAPSGGPVRLSHRDCGSEAQVEIRCASGHEVSLGQLSASANRSFGRGAPGPGPGAPVAR
jgi:DNA-binding HxlR family transcriptional regulator